MIRPFGVRAFPGACYPLFGAARPALVSAQARAGRIG
jgi:hypothetical protein